MENKDRQSFVKLIIGIAEIYEKKLSDATIAIYWDTLKDLPLASISSAAKCHIQDSENGKFMPRPAELRGACGIRAASPQIAWAEVLDAMEAHGAYKSLIFADGVTNAVIRDMGGWPQVCHRQSMDDNPIWIQKEFERKYRDYAQYGRTSNESLTGLHDTHNFAAGYLDKIQKEIIYIESGQMIDRKLLVSKPIGLIEAQKVPGRLIPISRAASNL